MGYTISMKKQNSLPDFTQLCEPAQNYIAEIVSLFIFFFFTASFIGYVWEVLIFLIKEGVFRNRGFLYGPWLPVYGIGAVLFYVLLAPYPFSCPDIPPASSFRHPDKKKHPITVFFLSALTGSGLELVIGWFLDVFWHMRYWDYSGSFLQFGGYVCLASAVGFGIAGVLWICIFSGLFKKIWFRLPLAFRKKYNTVLIFIFTVDCAAALIFPNAGKNITF